MEIIIGETHIRLTTDMEGHNLEDYIYQIRANLKSYIARNPDFMMSLEPLKTDEEDLSEIVKMMYESSALADVGPMACVAGTISELSLKHLILQKSRFSIVENGGDIALITNKRILCGIYSNNEILGNEIAFEIKPANSPLGICTSSGKIGHSISFGVSDSVSVISHSASLSDALATRIANDVNGETCESKVANALETAESYSDLFTGALIISGNNVATVGRLPKIVETQEFDRI